MAKRLAQGLQRRLRLRPRGRHMIRLGAMPILNFQFHRRRAQLLELPLEQPVDLARILIRH